MVYMKRQLPEIARGKLMVVDVLKLIIVYTHRPTGRVY